MTPEATTIALLSTAVVNLVAAVVWMYRDGKKTDQAHYAEVKKLKRELVECEKLHSQKVESLHREIGQVLIVQADSYREMAIEYRGASTPTIPMKRSESGSFEQQEGGK